MDWDNYRSNQIKTGIANGDYKNVVILSGAGISTNANIPDYRSANGIFSKISKEYPEITEPEDFFSRRFMHKHPEITSHPVMVEFRETVLNASCTQSHILGTWLQDRGILKGVITQNIDGLYQKAGIRDALLIELHGNLLRDDVVYYDDPIPTAKLIQAFEWMQSGVDLLIVMGTSLQVLPFAFLPNLVEKKCMRVLIDKNPDLAINSPFSGSIKFMGRRVTAKSQWGRNSKYKYNQLIFRMDCDVWSKRIMG